MNNVKNLHCTALVRRVLAKNICILVKFYKKNVVIFQRFPTRYFSTSSRFSNMDIDENYLYYSHQKLLNIIGEKGDENLGVKEYLKSVKYAPVGDFETGLEWFNVSEPLTFEKHLKGKIVVLDFFTYCCINCMHILPDLKEIEKEFSVEDGLVVVGVHSAKFENEKVSSNILSAVQRYNIRHPVVNDCNSGMWQNCDVHCWPTLLVLGPSANPIVMLTGEGHKEDLRLLIRNALKYYKEKNLISDHKIPYKSAYHLLPDLKGPLLFPGKITKFTYGNSEEILAISDSGNNRILLVKNDGTILQEIGGKKVGFKDGNLENAEFNNPQGLVFQCENILFVADTDNHAIRKIDLSKKTVETVCGTGVQGHDRQGGQLWNKQAISSPWDICIYKTSDMDLTFHADGKPPLRDVLIIAMAGTHQIWALFLQDTVWWKCKKYPAGTCICIAGSGREENRNNSYPQSAAFAQPSGLALAANNREIYIADSESSSVRRLSLVDGKVTPVVGGDRNPNNLFAFGDKDGSLFEAKLQHALGLAISPDEKTLFVADTYNHKLKKIDISQNFVSTLNCAQADTTDSTSTVFKEPAGLCVNTAGDQLYLADTNNHHIKIITLDSNNISKIETLYLKIREKPQLDKSEYDIISTSSVKITNKGGKLVLKINVEFKSGIELTENVPQKWLVDLPDPRWSCVPKNGSDLKNIDPVISVPIQDGLKEGNVDIIFNLVTCTKDTCLPKNFIVRVPVTYSNDAITYTTDTINVLVDINRVEVL